MHESDAPRLYSVPPISQQRLDARDKFCAGDVVAFELLCSPHLDVLYTVVLRVTGNAAIAEDVSQDALVRALDRCHQYDSTRPFRPWLLKIAVNLARDRTRTVWWRRIGPIATELIWPSAHIDEQIAGAENDKRVRDVLMRLPVRYREALALYYLNDMTYAEMSEITDTSISALKQRVRRGLIMLRAKMEEMYPDLAANRKQRSREVR